MFYIQESSCISPQSTFSNIDLENIKEYTDNKLYAIEPTYQGIPTGVLRRMGKAVRIGVGAALPILQQNKNIDGIVIGTANGGLEDCIKFLNQIIEYKEGTLTPTNFVQSTANAIASQISLLAANKGYNVTHVHRGHSFENAMIDVAMLLKENPQNSYLLGGIDEISIYNYNIQYLSGCYKKELISNKNLYNINTEGSIAGEGAAMFLVNQEKENSLAKIEAIKILTSVDEEFIKAELNFFLKNNVAYGEKIDLFLTGENGDNRLLKYYQSCRSALRDNVCVGRFKHLTGEHQSASALSLWFAVTLLQNQTIPDHMVKTGKVRNEGINKILIYNTYGNRQHTFILLSRIQESSKMTNN